MNQQYDLASIVHTFSLSANSANGLSFPNPNGQAALQAHVTNVEKAVLRDPRIQSLIGADWVPVWGPVATCVDTGGLTVHADNTMGCYYSSSLKTFVIAIAGTNANSPYDLMTEDNAVSTAVLWSSISPGAGDGNTAFISQGTATGLLNLLQMRQPQGFLQVTLLQALSLFIQKNNVKNVSVAVGGHSLGGALAPCLALYMYENAKDWNPTGSQAVATYALAGPTPGDSGFAAYYEKLIADKVISYTSLYNTLDVVPRGWGDLGDVPGIYDEYIKPDNTDSPKDAFMGTLVGGLQMLATLPTIPELTAPNPASGPYTQISIGRSPLQGTFDTATDNYWKLQLEISLIKNVLGSIPKLTPYTDSLVNVVRFVAQLGFQHNDAYPTLLKITDFSKEYQAILKGDATPVIQHTDGLHATVKRLTGVDLGALAKIAAAKKAAS